MWGPPAACSPCSSKALVNVICVVKCKYSQYLHISCTFIIQITPGGQFAHVSPRLHSAIASLIINVQVSWNINNSGRWRLEVTATRTLDIYIEHCSLQLPHWGMLVVKCFYWLLLSCIRYTMQSTHYHHYRVQEREILEQLSLVRPDIIISTLSHLSVYSGSMDLLGWKCISADCDETLNEDNQLGGDSRCC